MEEEIAELKDRIKELESELEKATQWQYDIQKWLDNCPR